MTYFMMNLLAKAARMLPMPVAKKIGDLLGAVTWRIVPTRRKRMAERNIHLALRVDEASARRIAKASWTRFGRMLIEVMAFPKIKGEIGRYARIEGKAHMDEALALGRGVVLATAHSGNWELLGAALALNGYPLVAVAQKQANADMDRLINEYRTLVGMHVAYKSGVREMIRLLDRGHIIGMLMDQDAGRDGVVLDFFGRKASCPQGPAFLARMRKAPIVPAFIEEGEDGTHVVRIGKMEFVEETDNKHADIARTTKRLTELIEAHIENRPAEWFWLHNRWKSCE